MTVAPAWDHAIKGIPEAGLERAREAGPDERERIARALELLACEQLEAAYTITPVGGGRYRVRGTFEARIVQSCGVTLEPVTSTIAESFETTFWPPDEIPPPSSGIVDLDEEADPEPIEGGQIEVGRIVFEAVAEAINPFPRKDGATLDWQPPAPPGDSGPEAESPFAVLAKIKTKG